MNHIAEGEMARMKSCERCWHFIQPDYSSHPGKCVLGVYDRPFSNTDACDDFEDRHEDEDEEADAHE